MLCVGRTHGIHAEPMTMGMKFGRWALALKRADRAPRAHPRASSPSARSPAPWAATPTSTRSSRSYVCEKLGLTPDPLSTQVIARDRHAQFLAVLATVAATAEEIATEVRALQKSDTLEAEEPFAKGQKGSSAMPHKRNPITAERVCGLARVIKANAQVGFDNVALWHERDISHSSAERVVLADSTHRARLHPRQARVDPRRARALSRAHARQPRVDARPHLLEPRAARARRHRHQPRGRLRDRAAQRDGGLGRHPAGARRGRRYRELLAADPDVAPPASRRRSSTRSSTRGRSSPAWASCSIGSTDVSSEPHTT